MAKLLYYLDFDYYEKCQKYFTGEVYKKLPMGPYPVSLEEITTALTKRKEIVVENIDQCTGYNPTEEYKVLEKPDISVLYYYLIYYTTILKNKKLLLIIQFRNNYSTRLKKLFIISHQIIFSFDFG